MHTYVILNDLFKKGRFYQAAFNVSIIFVNPAPVPHYVRGRSPRSYIVSSTDWLIWTT